MALTVLTQPGCAIRYADSRSGVEHLWGLGHLRMHTEAMTNPDGAPLHRVVTSSTVPGLCIDLGRAQVGVSFGLTRQQHLAVIESEARDELGFPAAAPALSMGGSSGLWGFGHLRMKGVMTGRGRYASVTGKALAGVQAGLGGGESGFTLGASTKQSAVLGEDVYLTFAATNRAWPYFDYFAMQVTAPAWSTNTTAGENPSP